MLTKENICTHVCAYKYLLSVLFAMLSVSLRFFFVDLYKSVFMKNEK